MELQLVQTHKDNLRPLTSRPHNSHRRALPDGYSCDFKIRSEHHVIHRIVRLRLTDAEIHYGQREDLLLLTIQVSLSQTRFVLFTVNAAYRSAIERCVLTKYRKRNSSAQLRQSVNSVAISLEVLADLKLISKSPNTPVDVDIRRCWGTSKLHLYKAHFFAELRVRASRQSTGRRAVDYLGCQRSFWKRWQENRCLQGRTIVRLMNGRGCGRRIAYRAVRSIVNGRWIAPGAGALKVTGCLARVK